MGATSFIEKAKAKDAATAFKKLVKNAQYEYGHAGYTGTIAEKSEFKTVSPPPPELNPEKYAQSLISDGDGKFWDDKWGPAACFEANGEFWFFGWASE